MKYNRNTAIDYRDYFHGFIEKLDKDSIEREERFTKLVKESEARLAADRAATEARLAADRKEAEARQQATEARLAAERKDFEAKFEAERKEARSNKRWLIGNFVALLVLAASVIVALINGG